MKESGSRVAIVNGCRTPFLRSGTGFKDLMGWQIGQAAVQGVIARTGIAADEVDEVIMGCVAPDIATTNIAREIVLGTGIPQSVPAHTCTVACISANQAITNGACSILSGNADVVIAGGVETFSDVDIRISRNYRRFLLNVGFFQRPKKWTDWAKLLKGMTPKDFLLPEKPSISEYSTGLIMGENADRLTSRLSISRKRQDEYAAMSHARAVKAQSDGTLDDEIIPVVVNGKPMVADNGPRPDADATKLATLKPVFDRKHGSVTAGNASFLTDGASAVLLMSERKAAALGLEPIGYMTHFAYTAMDPMEELLLGPAFSISKVLKQAGLSLDEVGVVEIHEAFAGQLLANLDCLASDTFARERLERDEAVGEVSMERLNLHGGSLSLGHPFGATGGRLLTTCCHRLKREGQRYGLVSGCAAGAVGNAILIENASVH